MCGMKINSLIVSYQDIVDNIPMGDDRYCLVKNSLSEARREVFLSNPFLTDKKQGMLFLQRDENVVIGNATFFPTKFKAGEIIENSHGGSNLYVVPEYRKYEVVEKPTLKCFFVSDGRI